jgi:hypothetical protein
MMLGRSYQTSTKAIAKSLWQRIDGRTTIGILSVESIGLLATLVRNRIWKSVFHVAAHLSKSKLTEK